MTTSDDRREAKGGEREKMMLLSSHNWIKLASFN